MRGFKDILLKRRGILIALSGIEIKPNLLGAFLLIGLVPLLSMGWITKNQAEEILTEHAYYELTGMRQSKASQIEKYFADTKADSRVLMETVSTLSREGTKKLTAVREVKKAAIERYLHNIKTQSSIFSEDPMVVYALQTFKQGYGDYLEESRIPTLKLMRRELFTYYSGEFTNKYRQQNSGSQPSLKEAFDKLSPQAVALQYQYIRANDFPLGSKHLLDQAQDGSAYSETHREVHPVIRNYLEKFGYYDIFLVDAKTGNIVYSVFKELDFATSLLDGPYAQTNFAEAFRRARDSAGKGEVVMADFAQYMPSYEAPAGFVASPIFDGEEKVGVAIFQFPIDRLNAIMAERSGLGETGETYLVGSDLLMRSDSYLDPEHHSVKASFHDQQRGQVDTIAAQSALAGETSTDVIVGYNGNRVLSAWTPIVVDELRWGLLSEIDVAEAFSPEDTADEAFYAKYIEEYGFSDLYLINPDGHVIYTVAQKLDYQTNLVNGPYRDSNLGKLFRQVVKNRSYGFADFTPYAPNSDEPAAFIAQTIVHGKEVEMVVALQLSLEAINNIMQQRDGMGRTGETYLVGSDKRMRSDSSLNPRSHNIKASFTGTLERNGVDTEAVDKALSGTLGQKLIIGYHGNQVLSAFTPLEIEGSQWALLAEMEEAEVMEPVNHLLTIAYWVLGGAVLVVVCASIMFTGVITKPIRQLLTQRQEEARWAEQAKEKAEQLAFYDPLTGLENRRLFFERLEHAQNSQERGQEEKIAVLYLDLDNFKQINDTLGHAAGDELLKTVANRLRKCVRKEDCLARLGGDEFAILTLISDNSGALMAQRILADVFRPITIGERELLISTSIGIAVTGDAGQDFSELLKNADLALYNAKELGRNNYQFFSEKLGIAAQDRMNLITKMRQAIKEQDFCLYYQPKVGLHNGLIEGLEALIRWHHPKDGFIFPDQFIPVAEESGLIIPIGEWVLRTACLQAKRLLEQGTPLPIAVNISGRQFHEIDLVKLIRKTLAETALPPHLLELEITETVLINDIESSIKILESIKQEGVSVAIDDFGTGFSSLNYLKHLPIDVLKVDRSFVNQVAENGKDAVIVQTIIELASRLNLKVVAEGIETEVQLDVLSELGCNFGQGYLFSRPYPIEELKLQEYEVPVPVLVAL